MGYHPNGKNGRMRPAGAAYRTRTGPSSLEGCCATTTQMLHVVRRWYQHPRTCRLSVASAVFPAVIPSVQNVSVSFNRGEIIIRATYQNPVEERARIGLALPGLHIPAIAPSRSVLPPVHYSGGPVFADCQDKCWLSAAWWRMTESNRPPGQG